MRRFVGSALLACTLVLGIGACQQETQADLNAEVVAAICKCVEPNDNTCAAMLAPELGDVTPECVMCVEANEDACAALVQDCQTACPEQQQPGP